MSQRVFERSSPAHAPLWLNRLRRIATRYGGPLLVVVAAALIRLAAQPYIGTTGFAISLIGMLIAAWMSGIGPCLAAQTATLVLMALWFDGQKSQHTTATAKIVSMLAFYFVGLTVAILSELRRSALRRVKAQHEHAESQRERMLATLSCMADGVLVCDRTQCVTLLNPTAEVLTGWNLYSALGRRLSEIFVLAEDAAAEPLKHIIETTLREQRIVQVNIPVFLATKNGKLLPVAYSVAPILDDRQNLTGVVLVFRDESERLRIELALRESDRRKEEFLATLAHELRNPLAPICMGVELLKTTSERENVDVVRGMLERQTRHMVRLIDDLLDVARISRGTLELRRSQVSLEEVVQNAIEETRQEFQRAEHDLIVTLPDNLPAFHADPNRLTQVLSNLLNNAAKFTPSQGRVELRVERLGEMLLISVTDNGQGLLPDKLESVFQMFTQVKHSLEGGQSGLGIGLTLVKRLVELHGGAISVESAGLNCGCRFQIRIPLDCAASEVDGLPSSPLDVPSSPVTRRVLVVDDNDDARKSLSMVLRLMEHHVSTASNGLEAVEMAETFLPDVIFMDLGMPQMNGYDAARRIRQSTWGRRMVLVATTGWGQADDRQRTRAAGFDHHLVKPVDVADIEKLLVETDCHRTSMASFCNDAAPPTATVPTMAALNVLQLTAARSRQTR